MDLNKSFSFSEEFDLDFGDISRVEQREDDYEDDYEDDAFILGF